MTRSRTVRAVCLALMISFLVNSTPAAPAAIAAGAVNLKEDTRFFLLSSNPLSRLLTAGSSLLGFAIPGTKKAQASISSIKIYPEIEAVQQGESVRFSAVAYDANDRPLSGVDFKWASEATAPVMPSKSMSAGEFMSNMPGDFRVTVSAGGVQTERKFKVTLVNNIPRGKDIEKMATGEAITVSSRDDDSTERKEKDKDGGIQNELLPGDGGWNGDNWHSSNDPGNQTGNPPGSPADNGAGNGNFQIAAPILSLAGRGTDVALGLNYNSRLWNKSYSGGNQLTYDIDRGFPGPGWSLGFGKIMDLGATGGALIVDADGTRHSFHGSMTPAGGTTYFSGKTTDGTFIDYSGWGYYNPPPGIQGGMREAYVSMPNGTYIQYGAALNGVLYPVYIRDINGNYLWISYRNNQGPAIQTITDTMGRVVNFQYDSLNRLISVTAPRMQVVGGGTQPERTLVKLHYKQLTLGYSFAAGTTAVVRDGAPWVLDAIYFPGTGSGYWFNDADSYSTYGMLTKVVEQRGMSWQASAEAQGTIIAGTVSRQTTYNYPLDTTNQTGRTNGSGLSDAPTYDTQSETWDGMENGPAVTKYVVQQNTTPRVTTVVQPSGTVSRQFSYNHPNVFDDGLVYLDESYVPDAGGITLPNVTGTFKLVGKSESTWQEGEYYTPRPTQSVLTEVVNGVEQKITKTFDYTGGHYNQIIRSCDYDNANVKLQCTVSEFENGTAYINRHLFNLVKATGIENADGTRANWTTYEYDNYQTYPLADAPGVIMHDLTYDPYTTVMWDGPNCIQWDSYECGAPPYEPMTCYYCIQYEQVSAYDPTTEKRGNVTKITTYPDANNLYAGAIEELRVYDKTGNNVKALNGLEQISFAFDDPNTPGIDTQYAYPVSQTRGSSDPNSPDRITSSSVYAFENGLVTSVKDPNGRISSTTYDPDSLRPTLSTSPTGAYTTIAYDDAALTVTEESREANNNLAGKSIKYVNGAGLQKREDSLGVNSVWDIVETKYNKLGQVWKQSRPYRAGDTVQWSETTYDEQGRTKRVTEPDGSYSEAFYNESQRPSSASAVLGQTIRVADAWGRERWGLFNQVGRLTEVVEPDPNGSGSVFAAGNMVTKYTSDTMGRLTKSEQGAQERKFKYDSLGRVTRQKLAEQTKTLNDAGAFVGAGSGSAEWSEAFSYDGRSNMTLKTDARGARTYYYYVNPSNGTPDPLNRIQAVIFDLSGPLEAGLPVAGAYNYSFEYMTTGDKMRIKKVEAQGLVKEEYAYDSEGRVSDYTQTIAYRENYPMTTSYLYDTLDRITDVRYPAQYGLTGSPRKLVQHTYDVASRLNTLSVDGVRQAGDIVYNSSDQTTSIKIGAVGGTQVIENYAFDAQTGLLTHQDLRKGKLYMLSLDYQYQRGNSNGTLNGKTGSLTKIIDNMDGNKNRDYEYDALGRLKKAIGGTNLSEQQYTYDRYGNRTNVTATGLQADGSTMPRDGLPNLTYNTASNRITTAGFEYDSMGNQTRALAEDGVSWIRYEYDAANRLRVVKQDNGTILQSFMYGSSNARLMGNDHVTNQLKLYCHSDGAEIVEYTETVSTVPVWTKSNVYMGSNVLSEATPDGAGGETVHFSHPDRLGTRVLTRLNGWFTSYEQNTLPFGTALAGETSGTSSRRFTSYDRSPRTGLDYAINRTYDSKQGRFTQVDPIGVKASNLLNPQTLNLYAYCGNDPINHVDPDGLFWGFFKKFFSWLGKILKFVAMVVAVVVAVLAVIYIPGLGIGLLAKVLGIISAIANALSEVLDYMGYTKAAQIFGIISAAASFGTSMLNAAGTALRKLADYTKKIIFGVIKAGATLASKILTRMGHSLAAKIAELVSFVSGYVQSGYGDDVAIDPTDKASKMKSVWKGRSWWKQLRFIRGLAERVASIAGATKVATYLGLLGVVEDVYDTIDTFGKLPNTSQAVTGTGTANILQAFFSSTQSHPRLSLITLRILQGAPIFNRGVGRINKAFALP